MQKARVRTQDGTVVNAECTEDGVVIEDKRYSREDVDFLSPVNPGKLVCAAKNYRENFEDESDAPDEPVLFLKTPNTVTNPRARVRLPDSNCVFFEGELGVIIGERCRNVAEANAMDVVAGFTCANDLTNRAADNIVRRKSFDGAAPLGPIIASPDRVGADATIETRINGVVRQRSTLAQLVFSVPELIASITEDITLESGDVVLTGSPSGMAQLRDGDRVEVEIEGISCLQHTVKFP